jgi:lipoprotein LprG
MRSWRRATLPVVAFMAIAGCSLGGSGGLPDAALMLRDAGAAGRSVKSAHVLMITTGPVAGLGFRRLDADAARGAGAQGVAVLNAAPRQVDFVETHGQLFVNASAGKYALASQQISAAMPGTSTLLDPDRGIAGVMMSKVQNPKTVAKENINGITAFRIVGTLPSEALPDVLASTHADAAFSVWLRVRFPHVPLDTRLRFAGNGADLDIQTSKVNQPVVVHLPG